MFGFFVSDFFDAESAATTEVEHARLTIVRNAVQPAITLKPVTIWLIDRVTSCLLEEFMGVNFRDLLSGKVITFLSARMTKKKFSNMRTQRHPSQDSNSASSCFAVCQADPDR